MAKKKTAGKSSKLSAGQQIRVRDGVCAPEFPEISCAGWTGVIIDILGKRKPDPQYVVEWDAETVSAMPENYESLCEERNLLYTMSCFTGEHLEVIS